MLTIKSRHIWVGAAVVLVAILLTVGAQVLYTTGSAEAFQPDGLRVSEWEMPKIPPCPYGHYDACESAASPPSLYSYVSANPHDLLPHVNSGHYHLDEPVDIEHFRQQVSARHIRSKPNPPAGENASINPGDNVSYNVSTLTGNLPWVADGQTDAEKVVVAWLGELLEVNPTLANSLVSMPFLQDYTPGDLQAVQALALISDRAPEDATDIANRTEFADNSGIENDEAKIIAVLYLPYRDLNMSLINRLISSGTIEKVDTVGKFNNQLNFSVIRTDPRESGEGNSALMDTAISATEHAETVMGQAMPTDFLGILVADREGSAGANNGISIQVDARFDYPDYDDRLRQRVVAHEIGHYWWTVRVVGERWVSEGAAEYIGAYSVKTQFGNDDLQADRFPCPYYRTIEHLRADDPASGTNGNLCNYSSGARLFIDLDRNTSGSTFNTAFRNFYQRVSTYKDDEIDQGLSLMRAFCSSCLNNPRALNGVGHTLARRYGEKVFTDNSSPDGSVPGLGVVSSTLIVDQSQDNRQYGIAEIRASGPDARRWLVIRLPEVEDSPETDPPEAVTVRIVQYYENREPWYDRENERRVFNRDDRPWFDVYLGGPYYRPIGHHWVYVYNEDGDKIAEAEYQVVP